MLQELQRLMAELGALEMEEVDSSRLLKLYTRKSIKEANELTLL